MTIDSIITSDDTDINSENSADRKENIVYFPKGGFSKIPYSYDIQQKRLTNNTLTNSAFITADFPFYTRKGKDYYFI